jgi:predicted SprT family Zn-dependent metalloprotease
MVFFTLFVFLLGSNTTGGKVDKRKRLLFSDYFDFDEETFRNIMVHEMIHYYLLLYGTNDKCDHGADFKTMAQEMNQKYGLNITTSFEHPASLTLPTPLNEPGGDAFISE